MSPVILPGATIGILGGGQLGRMTGMAARAMGYDVHVLDPDPDCPAKAVASRLVTAPFDDERAAASLAERCDVVTLEIEQVSVTTLESAGRFAPVRPSAEAIHVVQDRARQKRWLADAGFPLGDFRIAETEEEFVRAVAELAPCIGKATMGGYDGRGQARLAPGDDAAAAWRALGGRRCVVEKRLELDFELSVMTARTPGGRMGSFPPSLNHHDGGILTWSVSPAPADPALLARAVELAQGITRSLGIVGLLAVELFVTTDGALLVNELAPRPHNTFHQTERGCRTSQFEQLVRAVCDLPLGSTDVLRPAAIHNLLGDAWEGGAPDWRSALGLPGVRLHLYGKREARPGRKMGHLSADAETADAAAALVRDAFARLSRSPVAAG